MIARELLFLGGIKIEFEPQIFILSRQTKNKNKFMIELKDWEHQPQEVKGTCFFSGQFYITKGIQELLKAEEITEIYLYVKEKAEQENGLDYLQVFKHKTKGTKLFFIDQLNTEMKETGQYLPEYDYCTLMLASEY